MSLPVKELKRTRKYKKKDLFGIPKVVGNQIKPLVAKKKRTIKPVTAGVKAKRKPSAYNLFVQKHLKSPGLSGINQKEKMKKVAVMWRASKV